MRIFSSLLFVFFLTTCAPGTNKNILPIKDTLSEDSSTTKYDSLGYPDYYTQSEINDIADLKNLLERSTSVIACNFNGHNGNSANVGCEYLYSLKTGKRCGSVTAVQALNQDQIKELIAITCDTSTYDGKWSGLAGVCFIPHLGFAFLQKDSLIAQVNVCFLCSGIRTKPFYKSDGLTRKGGLKYVSLARKLGLEIIDGSSDLEY